MDGQLAAVLVICLIAEQIEKLRVDHGDQEVEGTVGITHNQKQCRFPVAQLVQFQFIIHGGIPNFLNVEGRKPGTAGNKDGLGRFAGDKLSRTFSSNSQKIQKRCQKHRMAPDTSFDRLHFSVQQVFAEIRVVWQLVDIWLPAPLDFRQFQRIGFLQCMIVACHI